MDKSNSTDGTCIYSAREAVGVFADSSALEAAVDEFEISGFDPATVSVLATDEAVKERVGHLYSTAAEMEDDRHVPQAAFVSNDSLVEGEAAAVGIPFYIGGCAGAGVATALGATLTATIVATIGGGAACAGLGALLAGAIARRRTSNLLRQLAQGGLVLWVSLRDDSAERRALQIMTKAGARDIHVHDIERQWTLKDRPLSEVQFDPFLWWS
jgi:hypothetical protein